MNEYTPTTGQVLSYIRGRAVMDGASANEAQEAATNWLAAIEREAVAKALEKEADSIKGGSDRQTKRTIALALRARAAEIREGKP